MEKVWDTAMGVVLMMVGFLLYIPTLVLGAMFVHVGRTYPQQERSDAASETLSVWTRHRRAVIHIVSDQHITRALLVTTFLSCIVCCIVTALYFTGMKKHFPDGLALFGPLVALFATLLYLAALLLTPVHRYTNAVLCFS
ncbi:hypothetical protein AGDE_16233 [Angomonas deanei]|uniref:Uncharacterized protein n=1 Tax=Angomonas deanei TaxID=59799 RepID=A0A7G2C532_9TRYP|nr:hypothetical protein AGDE_16233 [Angomonas deanei]CAD2213853.1 hypothetical protein, conserved [Angomonas deanei]|eukprot:EPY17479.1 hypothetical protein AGDE_16233 [Angomonas deanei]